MVLGLGDRAGGWKRGGVGGGVEGGRGKKDENYVMDGQKDNDVISTAYRCLLLWPISIFSGAFKQTGWEKKMKKKGGGRYWWRRRGLYMWHGIGGPTHARCSGCSCCPVMMHMQ